MSKDEANTMSDKPAAVEQGGEGAEGRETMQALDRLESEIAQAPVDRGSWGDVYKRQCLRPRNASPARDHRRPTARRIRERLPPTPASGSRD